MQETFGDEMSEHAVLWMAPSPLWGSAINTQNNTTSASLSRPAILRFASDAFMEQFASILERDPSKLNEYVLQKETWRGPVQTPATEQVLQPQKLMSSFAKQLARMRAGNSLTKQVSPVPTSASTLPDAANPKFVPLKLYQPAHQRYYLVAANLACGLVGFPDRSINSGKQEKASFVIRRLKHRIERDADVVNLEQCDEYAFVMTSRGNRWQKVTNPGLVPGEEQIALFGSTYQEGDSGKRRVLAGLIPVGKREAFMGASEQVVEETTIADPTAPIGDVDRIADPRVTYLRMRVTEPWKQLLEQAHRGNLFLNDPAAEVRERKSLREQIQSISWYVLLDFAKFLEEHIPAVWNRLNGQAISGGPTAAGETALIQELERRSLENNLATALVNGTVYQQASVFRSLKEALLAIRGKTSIDSRSAVQLEKDLDAVDISYDRGSISPPPNVPDPRWPKFLFPLADPEFPTSAPLPTPKSPGDNPAKLEDQLKRIDHLVELVVGALPKVPTAEMTSVPLAAQPIMDSLERWFIIRCVFERPECGPLHQPLLSEPTEPFQMANFFDPDAPARPIRIALPIDTTPAGLRKFDRNTAFMVSDVLCGQIDRVKGLSLGDLVLSVLPWPFHKELQVADPGPCKDDAGGSIGMMCSVSIPIITICALLLLMIIVNLLNIIFKWIPWFIMCFPIPGFKAKKT